jgi:hypothetical protein
MAANRGVLRPNLQLTSRRRLLQFLAASPLFAQAALAEAARPQDPAEWAPRDLENLIADPTQALDVFDFEPVMKKNVPPAHFGYMATGADDEMTLRANRAGFLKFELRPRRLTDVSKIDMSADMLSPRQRHRQGIGDRRQRRVHRPAVSVGTGRVRPARGRARARHAARRNARVHAADRRAVAQGPQACDGEAGLIGFALYVIA